MIINRNTKFLKDIVYGEINFTFNWVLEIIETKEFIRLSKIKQLGSTFLLYPNATHTRFSHSLGVFELAQRAAAVLQPTLDQKSKNELLAAALLHDIGHGPHSHSFEQYTDIGHEQFSQKIILDKSTAVNKVLVKNKIDPNKVVAILKHTHPIKWFNDLISSQIDVDRMDYLVRDSHFTGACYGIIDISLMLKWMLLEDDKICFNEKSISSIENFLVGRYHMYVQVYEKAKAYAYQDLIKKILLRLKKLYPQNRLVNKYNMTGVYKHLFENKPWTLEQYLEINDNNFEMLIEQTKFENDPMLKEAYQELTNFKNSNYQVIPYSEQTYKKYIQALKKRTKFPEIYIFSFENKMKKIYDATKQPILVQTTKNNKVVPVENLSSIINGKVCVTNNKQVLVINTKKAKL